MNSGVFGTLIEINWDRRLIFFLVHRYFNELCVFYFNRPPNDLIWPPNDLKWPTVTWNIFFVFFTKSHFGHLIRLFISVRGRWVDCAIRFEFVATKWPPNDLQMTSSDLQWPEKITFTISPLGHVIYLFIGFWGRWVDCAYQIWVWSRLMTSKWPKLTWKHNSVSKFPLGHVICLS